LAASAQSWQGHGADHRGGYTQRGGGNYQRGGGGYYGWAPGGFPGYFWNGNWYHHRRWNGGVWIYF
jgi:hypothetical protein